MRRMIYSPSILMVVITRISRDGLPGPDGVGRLQRHGQRVNATQTAHASSRATSREPCQANVAAANVAPRPLLPPYRPLATIAEGRRNGSLRSIP
jgi:hypothetical protein